MLKDTSDFKLVKDFKNGDESSFNKIVDKYKHKIYWHARRMTGNHFDADEVVQDVLLAINKNVKNFQFKSSLYTWIYKIVSTRSLNHIRRRKLISLVSFGINQNESIIDSRDLVRKLETDEKLNRIDELLQQLPSKQREVFILRNYDQLSYEEISELTGKSIGGLKANYFHSVKKIMELMKNYED